jgi:hypothetical protein
LIIEILQLPQNLNHSFSNIGFQKTLNCLFPCIPKLLLCVFIMNMKRIKWYMVGLKKILDVNLQENMCTIYYMTHHGPNFVSTPLQLDWRIHIKPIQSWPCNCGILHAPCVALQSNLLKFIKKSNILNDMTSLFHAFIYLCPIIEHNFF